MTDRVRSIRSVATVASVGAICLLVIGAVFVVFSDSGDDSDTREGSSSAPAISAAPTASDGARDDDCGITDTSQETPDSAPPDVTWTLWRGAALPRSESAGPLEVDDRTGLTGCYADTPVGALMAVINIDYRVLLTAPNTKVFDEQVADGPHKAEYREFVRGYEQPSQIIRVAGFRFVTYQKSAASIEIVYGDQQGGYAAVESSVVWEEGTWKGVAGADDTDPNSTKQLDDLTGYVPFRGVG